MRARQKTTPGSIHEFGRERKNHTMKISIHPTPEATVEVEAFETSHPELAIHEISVRPGPSAATEGEASEIGAEVGKVWAVSHVPSGDLVIYGLLTKDLAIAAAAMLTASGLEFGPGHAMPYLLDSSQAAASLMADVYFSIFCHSERGQLARA